MSVAKRILIIGGVAGGASAATRAKRLSEDAEILLFERGPYVSFANCGLPYHIGGVIPERNSLLLQTPESLNARFDIDVRVNTEIIAIDRAAKQVVAKNLRTGKESRERYDALVLSPGADPIRPALPGIDHPKVFTLRNMQDMDAIIADIPASKGRALVVGAGYIGLELAESFRHRGLSVTLVEKLPQVLAVADPEMTSPLTELLASNGVDVRLNTALAAIEDQDGNPVALFEDGSRLECFLAVLCIGVKPETKLAVEAGLAIGPKGGIQVDEQMRTSDPAIWAVGDAVEVPHFVSGEASLIPLAGPANRQGRIAAEVILGRDSRYKASQGTAICKVFNLAYASTGLSEKVLKQKGIPHECIYVHPADHATYYPNAQPMTLKLCFDPKDGRILGAQAVGVSGVDKRIDVLAVAMRAGMTVYDLEDLELCYAPPFGSAKDAVNMAGFVASNVSRGDITLWRPEELATLDESHFLLDVRTFEENALGTIPGAACAPLDELRDRLEDIPQDKEILAFCQAGLRGYIATRILMQHGYKVRNLSGGYKRYAMWKNLSHIQDMPAFCSKG